MGLWDRVAQFLSLAPMQERSLDRINALPGFESGWPGRRSREWRPIGVAEALTIPAITRCVTIISNVTAALSLEAYRNGARLANDERPRLVVRPNPLTTPGRFWQRTAYFMASRGEAWWWVAKRDSAGVALSLVPVHPREITVRENEHDRRYPNIEWNGRKVANADMIQIVMFPDESGLRGAGPLQLCGAAVNVAVEAQEWAANFFAKGGFPNVTMHDETGQLSEEEATEFKQRWTERAPNTPYFYSGDMKLEQFDANQSGAQMLDARLHQNGEAALMFGIPGTLLEHGVQGGSITYQNVTGEFEKLIRGCLWPNYLEPMEQAISDLLTQSTVGRFNLDAFLRPDPLTRYQIYKLGKEAGLPWITDLASEQEGVEPGDIERSPVPFAPAEAMPPVMQARSRAVRCAKCDRLLADLATPPYRFTCPRCKAAVAA